MAEQHDCEVQAYLDRHNIRQLLQEAVVRLGEERPDNPSLFLASHFLGGLKIPTENGTEGVARSGEDGEKDLDAEEASGKDQQTDKRAPISGRSCVSPVPPRTRKVRIGRPSKRSGQASTSTTTRPNLATSKHYSPALSSNYSSTLSNNLSSNLSNPSPALSSMRNSPALSSNNSASTGGSNTLASNLGSTWNNSWNRNQTWNSRSMSSNVNLQQQTQQLGLPRIPSSPLLSPSSSLTSTTRLRAPPPLWDDAMLVQFATSLVCNEVKMEDIPMFVATFIHESEKEHRPQRTLTHSRSWSSMSERSLDLSSLMNQIAAAHRDGTQLFAFSPEPSSLSQSSGHLGGFYHYNYSPAFSPSYSPSALSNETEKNNNSTPVIDEEKVAEGVLLTRLGADGRAQVRRRNSIDRITKHRPVRNSAQETSRRRSAKYRSLDSPLDLRAHRPPPGYHFNAEGSLSKWP